MCKEAGIKVKTAHSLRISCATTLFQAGVSEKMIREQKGHKSNALFKYQRPSQEWQTKEVSKLLGAQCSTGLSTTTSSTATATDEGMKEELTEKPGFNGNTFKNCKINVYYTK